MLASEDSAWTDKRVELLKKLWIEGLSCSQIASEIDGGFSRSAIIGKVHRLGLSGRRQGVQPVAPRPPGRREPSKPGPLTATTFTDRVSVDAPPIAPIDRMGAPFRARTRITDQNRVMDVCDRVEAPTPDPDNVINIIPLGQRCSLLELNDSKCRWPIGDPGSPEFFFCGGTPVEGLPYCNYHTRVAYVTAPDRRRERRASRG